VTFEVHQVASINAETGEQLLRRHLRHATGLADADRADGTCARRAFGLARRTRILLRPDVRRRDVAVRRVVGHLADDLDLLVSANRRARRGSVRAQRTSRRARRRGARSACPTTLTRRGFEGGGGRREAAGVPDGERPPMVTRWGCGARRGRCAGARPRPVGDVNGSRSRSGAGNAVDVGEERCRCEGRFGVDGIEQDRHM